MKFFSSDNLEGDQEVGLAPPSLDPLWPCSKETKRTSCDGNFFWNQGMESSCKDKSREESFTVMWLVVPGSEAECREEKLMT